MDRTAELAERLARHGRLFYQHGWMMGGSGNLSARIGSGEWLVTATGCHKGELTEGDFVRLDARGRPLDDDATAPSSDTVIHRTVYEHVPDVGAVYHVHEPHVVAATTRFPDTDAFDFAGYTILKAFGIESVDRSAEVPLLAGEGRAERVANQLERLVGNPLDTMLPAFAADHHGLYVWGESPDRARCHLEAIAHLFECRLLEETAR
jgi:methylthioribulose-1-phosphate dehydratase